MASKSLNTPLITVLIPTFNHANYLGEAIASVFTQTYSNWELIVIDNSSTDNTDEVLAHLAHPRMTVLKIQNNGSIAMSRNTGFAHAQGEWIAFLDSDDIWTDNKLEVCSKFFMPGVDLIYHDLKVLCENNQSQSKKVIKSRQVKRPVLLDLLIKGNTIATSSVVVRQSMLELVRGMGETPELRGTEDYNTWLKISELTEHFKHIALQLGAYRLHDANISVIKKFSPPRAAIAEFLPSLSQKEREQIEINLVYVEARTAFLLGNYSEAQIELKKIFCSRDSRYALKSLWMICAIYFHKLFQK
jgi:glycosyltransferase involved in cell wall biosynthesis